MSSLTSPSRWRRSLALPSTAATALSESCSSVCSHSSNSSDSFCAAQGAGRVGAQAAGVRERGGPAEGGQSGAAVLVGWVWHRSALALTLSLTPTLTSAPSKGGRPYAGVWGGGLLRSGGEGSRLVAEAWRALRCETSSGPLALVSIAPVIVGSIAPTGVM